ncbi:hypothetical protein ACWIUD_05990 [Helicobacter sp. 23-1044]
MALTPFAPLYAYISAMFVLIALSGVISREWRILLGITTIFNLAVIYASKARFVRILNSDDDFARYYQHYLDIYDGIDGAFFIFGNGLEVGLACFYKILSFIFPRLSPILLDLVSYICFLSALYVWLEIFMLRYFPKDQRARCVAFTFFVPLLGVLGLARQAFGSVILLYAICVKKWRFKLLFLFIASAFHLSSLLIFSGFYIIRTFPKISLTLIWTYCGAFVYDSVMLNNFVLDVTNMLSGILPQKVSIYFKAYTSKQGANLFFLAHLSATQVFLSTLTLFGLYFLSPNDPLAKNIRIFFLLCVVNEFVGFIMGRTFFILNEMLFYFVVFVALRRVYLIIIPFFMIYALRFIYIHLTKNPHLLDRETTMYFYNYPEINLAPFYYIFKGLVQ